jgi:hypothetical protein
VTSCFFLGPAPFLFEFVVEESNTPSSFLTDLGEDLEDFFLLAAAGQGFSCNCERSECYTCDATRMKSVKAVSCIQGLELTGPLRER